MIINDVLSVFVNRVKKGRWLIRIGRSSWLLEVCGDLVSNFKGVPGKIIVSELKMCLALPLVITCISL